MFRSQCMHVVLTLDRGQNRQNYVAPWRSVKSADVARSCSTNRSSSCRRHLISRMDRLFGEARGLSLACQAGRGEQIATVAY